MLGGNPSGLVQEEIFDLISKMNQPVPPDDLKQFSLPARTVPPCPSRTLDSKSDDLEKFLLNQPVPPCPSRTHDSKSDDLEKFSLPARSDYV